MFGLVGMVVAVVAAEMQPFNGVFFDGVGDSEYLSLLDIGRRQFSSTEVEHQSIDMLYRGDWDGMMEGPTWGAWWTQNSYGTVMTALPFMTDLTLAATNHAMAWWYNSMGNGTNAGLTHEGPAPDGCLCDAAVPCVDNNCCWFKQGDGDVPKHDWTMEESLSGVVMQAEYLLVTRNTTAIEHSFPLLLRTCEMLETRRSAATSNTTFLTGPSSNLLAPSFGGGPNVTKSYLTGVSITYTAALNRMIELASLGNQPQSIVTMLAHRRDLNLQGIANEFLTTAANGKHYFLRSKDPVLGTLHGKMGQAQFGYFEASPNHDAVYLRVVNDQIAEEIMSVFDDLDADVRPNVFVLPNTDAGGGVGYDDMLGVNGAYGTGKSKGGIFAYGTWVNGGVWSTQEGRMIMAYYRTNRQWRAAASMKQMLTNFVQTWQMDAPLPDFGKTTWAHLPTMLTVDAFACSSALVRGLFEYLYAAKTLTLIPHIPDNITAITQKFHVRWGAYRLVLSSTGVRSSGIQAVHINNTAVVPSSSGTTFNGTHVILSYANMPPPSASAVAAVTSDISTSHDVITIHIDFKQSEKVAASLDDTTHHEQAEIAVEPIPSDIALRFRATDLVAAGMKSGDPVRAWGLSPGIAHAVDGKPPLLMETTDENNTKSFHVDFDGFNTSLSGTYGLNVSFTVIAVIEDRGSNAVYSPVFHVDGSDRGLDIVVTDCATGWPKSSLPCVNSSARVIAIDWIGSGNVGIRNITQQRAVVSVTYTANDATSSVNGCQEQPNNRPIDVPSAGDTTVFRLGSRGDAASYKRFFKGAIYELIVYNRTLSPADTHTVEEYLQTTYNIPPVTDCTPKPVLDCNLQRTICAGGSWPRKCGLNASEITVVATFLEKLVVANLHETLTATMAQTTLDYNKGFDVRCAGLVSGNITALPQLQANQDSLTSMLSTSGNVYAGMVNAIENRYAKSSDPVAQQVVSIWKASIDFARM